MVTPTPTPDDLDALAGQLISQADSLDDLDALARVLANRLQETSARFLSRTGSSADCVTNLRGHSGLLANTANTVKTALLRAAVKKAVTSYATGHLSAVAREANITRTYLAQLVEETHPGWLEKAAQKRRAGKKPRARRLS